MFEKNCLFLADFENKYQQFTVLDRGGFGSVFEGVRKSDNLPVSLTNTCLHID